VRGDTLLLGIGNLLWADDGFGVRALAALHQAYRFPASVRLIDGGTQGLYLLPCVEAARRLLVFDAIDCGLAPGTLRVLRDGAIDLSLGAGKLSPHQSGFVEVLAHAALAGRAPEQTVLIGVQPAQLGDFGGSLSEPVRARLPDALALALAVLAGWGVPGRARATAPRTALLAPSLEIGAYEAGRPSENDACRAGDVRFLARRSAALPRDSD